MNKAIKTRWLKALRSGKYKQTQSCLADNKGYCCLGVLCDLYVKSAAGRKEGEEWIPDTPHADKYTLSTREDVLPLKVREWAAIDASDGDPVVPVRLRGKVYQNSLSTLNDSIGFTFARIATAIEKSL